MDIFTGILLVVSLITNFWQFNSNGELRAENKQLLAISKNCKLEEQDERKREFGAATERVAINRELDKVLAESEQHIRTIDQSGSADCRAERNRGSLQILDEARRRASEIDKLRMRSTRPSNGGS